MTWTAEFWTKNQQTNSKWWSGKVKHFRVLRGWHLKSICAESTFICCQNDRTCPLFISACAWPWQGGWCRFSWGSSSEQTGEKSRLKIQPSFAWVIFSPNLLPPLGLHGYTNTSSGTFATVMWRRVRENRETSRKLLKLTLLQKGKSHHRMVWDFTNLSFPAGLI